MPARFAVAYIVHDDWYYLAASLQAFAGRGDRYVFVSRVPWNGETGNWEKAASEAEQAGATVVLGDWDTEEDHRQFVSQWLKERDYTHAFIPDSDEIPEPRLLDALCALAEYGLAERVYVHIDTYWKSPEYVIRPREAFTPCLLIDIRTVSPVRLRQYQGGRPLLLPPEYGILHHLSYAGPEERIRRKVTTWSHHAEVHNGWWEQSWKRWDTDRMLRNVHPTEPPAYGFTERIHVPDLLMPALQQLQSFNTGTIVSRRCPDILPNWPTVSVIIPLHGGRQDIAICLQWLELSRDILHEVIVVDNASPDDALTEVERFPWIRIIRNTQNEGFAGACNQGMAAASGNVLLFLNSDTALPRSGLICLIQSLLRSGSIAATGPYTNRASGIQQITSTYTSLDTLELFAQDFAARNREDRDVDMLIGFCLAVHRRVLDEVGGFDKRFGLGTFEDNDLCYRIRRAGYRLTISGNSFVHHTGSQTLLRMDIDTRQLLRENQRKFEEKWRLDIELGYASHLSGLSEEPIRFAVDNHPDTRLRQIRERARQADISLCMIVRNEERVLDACLKSAAPFFREMIVVDTGSTDKTKEIAEAHGAQVYDFAWPDSFALARNESLRHANGRWIFWLDADDTLPWESGEAILAAALEAPADIVGFVVPVQFIENVEGGNRGMAGTRVDHVKLFRNLPGVAFDGRIHEQVLPSLRQQVPNGIARCRAIVLHSGYDTSPEGQARKRQRDASLFELELQERPNHPFVLFSIGMTDHFWGEYESAVKWLRASLERSHENDSHVRKAYALLAISLRELGEIEDALKILDAGLAITPDDPELLFHKANLLASQGNLEEAHACYLQMLQTDISTHFSSVDMTILGFKAYHNLGNLCMQMDRYEEARYWWLKAMEDAPQFLPSAFGLFDAALQCKDFATAQQTLTFVQQAQPGSDNWANMGAQYAEAVGGPNNALIWLSQIAQQYPQAVGPSIVLARRLLNSGHETDAKNLLLSLNEAGVAEAAFYLGISAVRTGNLPQALEWMERAHSLDPNHEATRIQRDRIRQLLKTAP